MTFLHQMQRNITKSQYKLFGINPLVVRVALSIFSSFTCLIVYKIAKEVFDRRSALIAMFISATYCMMFCWCSLLSETLFTFFLMLGVLYLVKSRNHPNLRYLVFGGMYLGLATLTRAYLFPFFLLVPFWAFVTFKNNLKLTSKACCIVICTMFLVISPATVRNCLVTHKFIPIIGQSGATFLGANNPEVLKYQKGGWIEPYKSGLFKEEEIIN
ncbi:MAG: glycosyltransferase family 39 protein [Candidatus Firestonebacteria bacterium]